MSRHATAELLSAYLDDELDSGVSRALAGHLERCPACRARFASLRSVVATVRRLERQAPPPVVGEVVARRLAFERRPASARERLEGRLSRLPQPSSIFYTFALLVAFAVVIYLFAEGVERAGRPRTALVLAPAPTVSLPTGEVRETRQAAGRTFDLIDGVWRERGIEQPFADFPIEAESDAGRALLAHHPDLAALGDRVVLRLEGSVVELRGAAAPLRLDGGGSPPP